VPSVRPSCRAGRVRRGTPTYWVSAREVGLALVHLAAGEELSAGGRSPRGRRTHPRLRGGRGRRRAPGPRRPAGRQLGRLARLCSQPLASCRTAGSSGSPTPSVMPTRAAGPIGCASRSTPTRTSRRRSAPAATHTIPRCSPEPVRCCQRSAARARRRPRVGVGLDEQKDGPRRQAHRRDQQRPARQPRTPQEHP
jgi:hypothetical protein